MQRRRIGIGLGVFAAAAIVGFAAVRPPVPASLHREIETRLTDLLGGPVQIGELRLSLRWGVLVEGRDLTVWPSEGGPALHVSRATAKIRIFSHLTGQERIRSVRLERPLLHMTHHPDGSITPEAVSALFADSDEETPTEGDPSTGLLGPLDALEPFARNLLERLVVAESFEILGGRIEFVDLTAASPRTIAVAPVQARLTRSVFGKTKLALRGRLHDTGGDRGAFEWESSKGPEEPLTMAVTATGLELAAVLPWVGQPQLHTHLGNRVLSGELAFASPRPDHGRLEIDLIAHDLENELPSGSRSPLEADRVTLDGVIAIAPDHVGVEAARLSSNDLSLELDATIGRPLGPESFAELALAVRDATVVDLRHVISWLPEVRREEAEALLASVKAGRLRLLRTAGRATLHSWQAFLAGRTRTLPRDFVIDADLVDATVHVEGEDHLESLSGRMWWTDDRVEFQNFGARLNASPLPRLDLTIEGVSHLFASEPEAREISGNAPPLEGLRTLWLATHGESSETGSPASFQIDIDHLHHPMFYWPIADVLAGVEILAEGAHISVERGRWAGVPVSGDVYWDFEPREHVRARFAVAASLAPDSPEPREATDTWVQGRFRMGAFASEQWAHEDVQGGFAARGSTLELYEVDVALAPHGHVRASGHLDLGRPDAVPVGLRFDIENGDISSLATSMSLPSYLTTGAINANGSLTTNLRAESSSAADLTGRIAVDARNGSIGRAVPAALAVALAGNTVNPFAKRDEIHYDTLVTELNFEAGMLRTDALSLEGPDLRAFASGSVDIAREPHELEMEVVFFLFRPVDSLLGLIPLVDLLLLGPNDNLVATHYRLEGPASDPEATLLPFRSFTSGPGTVVFETLPSLVRRGIETLGALFEDETPEPLPGPAAGPET
ncbi:MAG: AsmA-like C-terminal region-containing protein [Myxococcota bacterium]|nr:hypothetical protein [bacterium]MDP6076028.1 AsmA-like C-terminal region-containing protein [Myxococcota bacterium]MDP7076532.1 AsmA-like C-terminal region-containing protein [Myxococcota bacterium]MDP7299077.1 AsmA-like C-terminal region-containing protein [Myxococcota bacterium]MDP7431268.1 AsmA-like C-terminal region-containing protein [Myxococcota bacterium]